MDWVNFDEIKKTVSLEMVINRYGWTLRKMGSHILRGKCPLPSHTSDNSKESFIATLNKGTGGAWSCHSTSCAAARGGRRGGNVLDLVAAVEQCSVRDAAIKLQTWFLVAEAGKESAPKRQDPAAGDHPAGKEPEGKLVSEKTGGEAGDEEGRNKPLTFALKSVDPTHPYFKERGITEKTAREFSAGFFSGRGMMAGRIVFSIENRDGELVGYAGRSIDGTEPRYKFPPGFRKSQELFNFGAVRAAGSVVLVEGFFDCMKVWQAGYLSAALMGSTMSRAQENLIAEHFGEVILMLDGDEAGRKATAEIGDRLMKRVFRVMTIDLPVDVQPDQLSESELEALLGAVVSWTRSRGVVG